MPTCRSWKTGIEFGKWRPCKVRSLVSNSIYAKEDRNGPPSANQVASKDEPRRGHAVCTLQVHLPTSPCPALSAHVEPKSQGHCRKWHHEAESLMTLICAIGPKGFNIPEKIIEEITAQIKTSKFLTGNLNTTKWSSNRLYWYFQPSDGPSTSISDKRC